MGTELEWKYDLPDPRLSEAILNWDALRKLLAGTPRHYHMQTTYYDTQDRRLASCRITLRRRLENEASVICCKAPLPEAADGPLHGEWELSGDSIPDAIPNLLAMGAPAELAELTDLLPVCGADFYRRAVLLQFPDGSSCELALDHGTLFGPERSEPLCELELEMKEGAPNAALALAQKLAARFGLRPQPLSKFARARKL